MNMALSGDLQSWAAKERLPPEVTSALRDNGFNSVEDLANLSPEDIKAYFQDTQLLKLAQCLALKRALANLSLAASSPNGVSSPPSHSQHPPHHHLPYPPTSQAYPNPHQPNPRPHQTSSPAYPHPQPQAYPAASPHPNPPYPTRAHPSHPSPQAYPPHYTEDGRGAAMSTGGENCYRFLLSGKTGSGKSTTGNTIFGQELFETAATFSSVTVDCERKTCTRDGRKIEIIDSPGLYDTHKTQEEICVVIVQAVAGMHPGPHAILFVVRLGRFTQEEHGAYTRLISLFDPSIVKHIVVVFTHGDMLERDGRSIESMIQQDSPKELHEVLRDCENRYVVFNNYSSDPGPQVRRLLSTVDQMVARNGGLPYTCPKYGPIGQGLEEEVARRLQEVEKKDLKRQKYVQQLERQTKEAEESAKNTKERFEENEEQRRRKEDEAAREQQKLEKELKSQLREQQRNAQKHQDELNRLRLEREEQERAMKEKEHEMTEREKKRAQDDAEKTRQREQEMRQEIAREKERQDQQRAQDEERRRQKDAQWRKLREDMEAQRVQDRQEMQKKHDEMEQAWQEKRDAEKAAAKKREHDYDIAMEKAKDDAVKKNDTGFFKSLLGTIANVAILAARLYFKV